MIANEFNEPHITSFNWENNPDLVDIFQPEPENWTDYVRANHMNNIDVTNMLDQEKDKKKLKGDKKVRKFNLIATRNEMILING